LALFPHSCMRATASDADLGFSYVMGVICIIIS